MLTYAEFRSEIEVYKAVKQLQEALATSRAALKDLWDKLDKDKNGKVTGKERGSKVYANKDAMARFFGGSDMASIGKAFNRIDHDGNDSLTWEEFIAQNDSYKTVQQMQEALGTREGKAEFKALFDKLDKDKSGTITGKEWGSQVSKQKDLMAKYFGG